MYVLYGHAELFIPHSDSLKEKRKTIQSIIARIRKRFNISMAEVAYQELWQRSGLGFTAVSNTATEAELMVTVIRETLDQHEDTCSITDFFYEVKHYL